MPGLELFNQPVLHTAQSPLLVRGAILGPCSRRPSPDLSLLPFPALALPPGMFAALPVLGAQGLQQGVAARPRFDVNLFPCAELKGNDCLTAEASATTILRFGGRAHGHGEGGLMRDMGAEGQVRLRARTSRFHATETARSATAGRPGELHRGGGGEAICAARAETVRAPPFGLSVGLQLQVKPTLDLGQVQVLQVVGPGHESATAAGPEAEPPAAPQTARPRAKALGPAAPRAGWRCCPALPGAAAARGGPGRHGGQAQPPRALGRPGQRAAARHGPGPVHPAGDPPRACAPPGGPGARSCRVSFLYSKGAPSDDERAREGGRAARLTLGRSAEG